jgi:hypothetical protein
MDKRREERVKKRVVVKLNDKPSILEDISKNGIKLTAAHIPPSRYVDITIEAGEEKLALRGYIRWIKRQITFHSPKKIGLSLIDVPDEYYTFLETLGIK